jgi:tetratricopeptide (TPR) repeat protein
VAFRWTHGLTQQQVADGWNALWPTDRPLTNKQVSYWEAWPQASGRPPAIDDLNRLARLYQCRAADLLDDGDSTADSPQVRTGHEVARRSPAVLELPVATQATSIVGRVADFLMSYGAELVSHEGGYEQLVAELTEWANRMQRRDVLHWLSFASAAAAAAPILARLHDEERERTILAFASPDRVDGRVVDHIEAILWQCMRQDDALGPMAAMETALAQRNLVRGLLPAASGVTHARLLSLYANILRFAGWLSFDLNNYDTASRYFEGARTAAHEAHNAELGALVLCNMSHLATWRGQPRTGIDHALAAGGWAARTDDDHLKAYAFDVAARAYAMDKQQIPALDAVDSARTLIEHSAGSPTGLVYFYNAGQLASTESTCYLFLEQPELGAPIAERAVGSIGPGFVRNLALASLRLGICRIRSAQADVPQAAAAIEAAVELAAHNQSARVVDRLRSGIKELEPWAHLPEVREVSDRALAYGLTG